MTCFPHTISPAFSILLCSLTKSICLWKGKNEAAIFLLWLWLEVWKDADENWDTCESRHSFCSRFNIIRWIKCFKHQGIHQIITGICAADFPLMNDVTSSKTIKEINSVFTGIAHRFIWMDANELINNHNNIPKKTCLVWNSLIWSRRNYSISSLKVKLQHKNICIFYMFYLIYDL